MLEHLKQNTQLYCISAIWFITGLIGGPAIYILLPATLLIFAKKKLYQELLIGFFFILILSDNVEPAMKFAGNVKNIYIVILAYVFLRNKSEFTPYNNIYKIFIPFFLFSLYCLIDSPVFVVGIQKTISYALVMLVIPNYFIKCYRENGQEFIKRLVYFGITMLGIGFLLILIPGKLAYIESGRFRGVFGNPNGLGLFCFVFLSLLIAVNNAFKDIFSKKEKIWFAVIILASIILSQSRNALVGCLILLIFERFFKKSVYLGIVFMITLVFINFLVIDQIPFLIKQMGLENFLRLSTITELSGRAIAWHFVWQKIQNNIFFGHGFGYDEFLMRSNYYYLSGLGHQGGVHNSYLSIWLNFGLIGLIIYFRSFLLFFIRTSKINNIALPIMYAVVFSSTFEGLLIGSLNPHMFTLLIIFTLLYEVELQPSIIKIEQ